ncbi:MULTISPECIES: Hpt domain-containing protein [unclassified Duganella]|uniref:Hpt domain-containing protein n=1 Tax=unclassified Duganella TaxID=2636909 RepID=UPI001587AD47|nr:MULTISPECIES: Hpt domain-containing protein [unclassified Duganella]
MSLPDTMSSATATETNMVIPELPKLAGVDLSCACKLLGGNHALLLRTAQAFLRDYAAVPQTIAAFHQAGDYAEVGRIAHMIKGAASYFCARGLAASAAALEQTTHAAAEKETIALMAAFLADMALVLDELSCFVASRSEVSAQDAGSSDVALTLVLRIAPLLENGDYAAIPLLEKLADALEGEPPAASATAIIDRFEELDIDGALKLLSSLSQTLRASRSEAVR